MPLRHIVLFKLRPGITWEDKRVTTAARFAASHGEHIPEIRAWWAGPDICGREIAYDFAVMGLFDDQSALDRYQVHPHHQQGIALWQAIATWIVVDLEEATARQPAGNHE